METTAAAHEVSDYNRDWDACNEAPELPCCTDCRQDTLDIAARKINGLAALSQSKLWAVTAAAHKIRHSMWVNRGGR